MSKSPLKGTCRAGPDVEANSVDAYPQRFNAVCEKNAFLRVFTIDIAEVEHQN